MKDFILTLNMIKSIKILKSIFNHLRNKKKLILLNYNKYLQNKLGFTIDDYKQNSKRIKIGGLNGYGKECSLITYKLIFEGKYLKGKRNGKGIEYFENGRIKFQGEYFNGEKLNGIGYDENGKEVMRINNGIVKELYDNGLVKFEGKYLNGKKWTGIGYTYYGIKIYEIKNGKGYIREYNPDGTLLFKGNYLNGERNGEGKEYSQGKLLFEGNYINGIRNGEGREYYDNLRIKFEGEYVNDKRWNGIVYYFNGNKKCEIKEGKEEEEIENINNTFYNVAKSTLGIILERLKEKQITYKREVRMGQESKIKNFINEEENKKEFNKNAIKFEGEYINGKLNGKGKEYFFEELIFEGEYIDGKKNGFGKDYYNNGRIKFEGEYQDGIKNGKGKEYDYFGRLIFEGKYVNNKRMNGIIYKYNNNYFSKYIYLIPAKYFSQYENKVPIDKIKKYHNKYHIKSSILKCLNSKRKEKNEKLKFDKKKNKWNRNKKCRWSINIWR